MADLDIKDFKQAFDAILDESHDHYLALIESEEAPNFENLLGDKQQMWQVYRRLTKPFWTLIGLHQTEEWFEISNYISKNYMKKITIPASNHPRYFEKVKILYNKKDDMPEYQRRLVSSAYRGLIKRGMELPEKDRQRLSDINIRLGELRNTFKSNLNSYYKNNYTFVDDVTKLEGLPQNLIDDAKALSKDKGRPDQWCLTGAPNTGLKYLQYLKDRELRYEIFHKRSNICMEGDINNYPLISEILALREEKIQILGEYDHYADYQLRRSMPGGYERVQELLDTLHEAFLEDYIRDLETLESFAYEQDGITDLGQTDMVYYEELYKNKTFGVDQKKIMEYFTFDSALNGFFEHAKKLFGLTFKERHDIRRYYDSVQYFDVYQDAAGQNKKFGMIFIDPYERDDKSAGAWMMGLQAHHVNKDGQEDLPISQVCCNYSQPTDERPSLLSFRDVEVLFHEFGHALHNILSQSPRISIQAGTAVNRELVELPSQIQERWLTLPDVIQSCSAHYQTGKTLPQNMIERLLESERAFKSFFYLRQNKLGRQDIAIHTLIDAKNKDADYYKEMDQSASTSHFAGLTPYDSRSALSSAAHIFAGGYTAKYWSYIYSEILDACGFSMFEDKGYYDPETAEKLRQLMDQGGTRDPMDLFIEFYGSEPDLGPFFKSLGLNKNKAIRPAPKLNGHELIL